MPAILTEQLQHKLGQLARTIFAAAGYGAVAESPPQSQWRIGLALALDAWLILPSIARWALTFACLAACGFAAWRWLIAPLRIAVSPAALAAAVEAEFPRLDERLSSSVELAEAGNDAFGSPALIDLLIRETDSRTRAIDFERAAPSRIPRLALGLLGASVIAAIVVGVLWPDWMAGLGRRFLRPWDDRLAIEPFAIILTSSGDAVAQGRSWQVHADLAPRQPGAVLPDHCTLTIVPEGGSSTRYRMQAESTGAIPFLWTKSTAVFGSGFQPDRSSPKNSASLPSPHRSWHPQKSTSRRLRIRRRFRRRSTESLTSRPLNSAACDGLADSIARRSARFGVVEGGKERRIPMTLADDSNT